METDASDKAIGAYLNQETKKGILSPIIFHS